MDRSSCSVTNMDVYLRCRLTIACLDRPLNFLLIVLIPCSPLGAADCFLDGQLSLKRGVSGFFAEFDDALKELVARNFTLKVFVWN